MPETSRIATSIVVVGHDPTNNTHPDVWICRKRYALPPQYSHNASGQLKNDQEFSGKLPGDVKTNILGMCAINPIMAIKLIHRDTKADLIFKRVFCTYL